MAREERFWAKVDRSQDVNECWPWTGHRKHSGYGGLTWERKQTVAHRVAYQITHDVRLTRDILVCHRCDNPPCCNPKHLFAGTTADNMADMKAKGRHRVGHRPRGEEHKRTSLNNAAIHEIRRLVAAGMVHAKVAEQFGVAQTTVSNIVARRTWGHVA